MAKDFTMCKTFNDWHDYYRNAGIEELDACLKTLQDWAESHNVNKRILPKFNACYYLRAELLKEEKKAMQAHTVGVLVQSLTDAITEANRLFLKNSLDRWVVATDDLVYCLVDRDKGLNGSNVSVNLLEPFIFRHREKAIQYSRDVKAYNGAGVPIAWKVFNARDYFTKCVAYYTETRETVINGCLYE